MALIFIGIFGAAVIALFGYVYWATASYMRSRSDQAIAAELTILQKAYTDGGGSGLINSIAQRIADERFEGGVFPRSGMRWPRPLCMIARLVVLMN